MTDPRAIMTTQEADHIVLLATIHHQIWRWAKGDDPEDACALAYWMQKAKTVGIPWEDVKQTITEAREEDSTHG